MVQIEDTFLKRGKLSKKMFYELTEGLYLVSNLGSRPDEPVFQEKVVPVSKRDEQWERIRAASADQRMCMVFKNKRDYNNYIKAFLKAWKKKT